MTYLRLTSLFIALAILSGCTSTRTSDTARTGMEQLLISNAIDKTLDKTPFPPVSGRKVFLDSQYLDCVDKGYVISSIRQRLLNQGAQVVGKTEDSEMVIEIRSGGIGTDNVDSFIGMPSMSVPGPMPIDLPEVRMWEKTSQYGTAKIGIVAYRSENGTVVFDSGHALARSDDNRWSIMGVGPFQSGSVRSEVNAATQGSDLTARIAHQFDTSDDSEKR